MEGDFDFLKELIANFFKQEDLQQKLQIIYEDERIRGWELWLQIELACFLAENTMVDWERESSIAFDGRKERNKTFFKPDFLLRKKGWRRESYIALEIKQHSEAIACIDNMLKDIEKVSKARESSADLRCFYALGIFKKEENKKILKSKILDKASRVGWELEESLIEIQIIKNTSYVYAIF